MKFTNVSTGPRGLNTKTGLVMVDPRQSIDVEISDIEAKSATESKWFVKGDAPKEDAPDNVGELQQALAERNAQIDDLNKQITDRDAIIDDMKAKLAQAEGGNQNDGSATYEARDKGQGWWGIFDQDGKEVGKSIREADATAFNAMTAEEKAQYVAAE